MKERFVDIKREDVPAIYEIGVGENGTTLRVSVHSSIAGYVEDITGKKEFPLVEHMAKELSIPKLVGFSAQSKSWGFGEILVSSPSDQPEWVTWNCKLPKKQENVDWTKRFAISATLNLLSRIISIADKDKGDTRPQLFELEMLTERDLHGSSLAITLARAFMPWISSEALQKYPYPQSEQNPKITPPMRTAYEHMAGSGFGRFNAWFRPPKWVNLGVPGDACGLDPQDYYEYEPGSGYKLLPHNIDSPIQQLSLLMGIAAMHDEARK